MPGTKSFSTRVQFIQRILPDYRIPFFDALQARLADSRIELDVFYGQELPGSVPRSENCAASWAHRIVNRYFSWRETELVWQPCLSRLRPASLIIVEQANRLAVNYPLLAGLRPKHSRVAFWGHGRNYQASSLGLGERVKRSIARLPDWWFAYTDASADIVASVGYPRERITVVQNAVDDAALRRGLALADAPTCASIREEIDINSEHICVYCGGLYEAKRLDLLMEAGEQVRTRIGDFQLLIIGRGPQERQLAEWARDKPWVHLLGHLSRERLAPYLKISRLLLIPGAVGLAVVDSFVSELPLVTCEGMPHGPEISYLVDGVNGVLAPATADGYAAAVVRLLREGDERERLARGCRQAAARITLEEMVGRFTHGLLRWARAPVGQ